MIRLLLVLLFLILFFIITIPIVLMILMIGCFSRKNRDIISFYIVKYAFKFILFISGVKIDVNGLENIPDEPVLYIGNHNSFFDIVVGYAVIPKPTGFVAKKELLKVVGLDWWMVLMNCLFLDREDPRQGLETIKKAADFIEKGVSIFIFPEGTRSKDGRMGEFKEGSFKVATKAACQIVPVAFTDTANILENHFPSIKSARVSITFGKPIETASLSRQEKKQLGVMTKSSIQEILDQM